MRFVGVFFVGIVLATSASAQDSPLLRLLKSGKLPEDEHRKLHDEVQKLTDLHVKKVDDGLAAKEKEIMQV